MPSVKRCRLLSDLERDRLLNRDSLDRHTRVTNDVRVRKKLLDWLKEVDDVLLVIDKLPKDSIQKTIDDKPIFDLMYSAINLMKAKDFRPITGEIGNPESWHRVVKKDSMFEDSIKTPATDADIVRSARLYLLESMLEGMLESDNNPVSMATGFRVNPGATKFLEDNPSILEDRPNLLTDFNKAFKRMAEAEKAVYNLRKKCEDSP